MQLFFFYVEIHSKIKSRGRKKVWKESQKQQYIKQIAEKMFPDLSRVVVFHFPAKREIQLFVG